MEEDKELLEIVERANNLYKKKISCLLQFLKKNNLNSESSRKLLRGLTRQAKIMNDNLCMEVHSLYRFLQLIEMEAKWVSGEFDVDLTEDVPMFQLAESLINEKNRSKRRIKDVDQFLKDFFV